MDEEKFENEIVDESASGETAESTPEEKAESPSGGGLRRRLTTGAVALVTSASVLVGGIFQSPALLPDDGDLMPQVVYTESDDDDLDGSGDDGDEEETGEEKAAESAVAAEEMESPPSVWDDVRRRLQKLPLAVKLLAIPLAALLCWLVFTGVSALLGSVLGVVAAKLIAWLLTAGAVVGGTAVAAKALFPDVPLKKILNRRTVSGALVGAVTLAAADLLLPLVWTEYVHLSAILRALGLTAVIGVVVAAFSKREKKRRALDRALLEEPEPEEEPEEVEEEKPLTREDILAIADTVSRKR